MRIPMSCAFVMGAVSGTRSLLGPAAISRAARSGTLQISGTRFAFLGGRNANVALVMLALGELVADKLPITPSRKKTAAFVARVVSGAIVGGAIGASARRPTLGALVGAAGAFVGTEAGAAFRAWLASLFERDLPAAVIEDMVAFALIGYASSKMTACAAASEQMAA